MLSIDSSEKWHNNKYGDAQSCYDKYLLNDDPYVPPVNDLIKIMLGNESINKRHSDHNNWKYDMITKVFPDIGTSILDIGSTGFSDMFLLRRVPSIENIVCIDGQKSVMEQYKPFLDKRITQIYCNFLSDPFPIIEPRFDTILQIDFPEHLPDNIYEKVTRWSVLKLKVGGNLIIYTPEYPHNIDQIEHISVKSLGYFIHLLLGMNMILKYEVVQKRIFILAIKRA